MEVSPTQYTVADYCKYLERSEIVVNPTYQRSARVWPAAARSFLIETILLGYPMPKLSLHQVTDIKTRSTKKEIIDGQQRSQAIRDFFEDNLRLVSKSEVEEAAGKRYSELDDELKQKFLDYRLSADLFVGATVEDIRETFRRINSYTVPLNAEEKRHARYQGDFKWFIYRLTRKFSQPFADLGVFTEKQLTRMQDAKLLSEVTHALLEGISTTREGELKKLYESHDKNFQDAQKLEDLLSKALSGVLRVTSIREGPLMKPYNMYALLLGFCHYHAHLETLRPVYTFTGKRSKISQDVIERNLSRLAAAVEDPDSDKPLKAFVEAGAEKTNVADQRKKRFVWVCRALADDLP